jgi:hypothetical protein
MIGHLTLQGTLHEPLREVLDETTLVQDILGALPLEELVGESIQFLLALSLLLPGQSVPPASECNAWPVTQKSVQSHRWSGNIYWLLG